MNNFEGKKVFVTGAGVGIGFGLCKAFALEGATVALNDVSTALAAQAAEAINVAIGRKAVTPFGADVSEVDKVKEFIDKFADDHSGLDVVVANAGITNYGSFLDYSPKSFDKLLAVNLRGSYFTAQAAAKAMIKFGVPGRIVFMSSVTGVVAHTNLSAYGATKSAIQSMTKTIALELGKYQITVNSIAPGATVTERTLIDDPDYERNWKVVTPLQRPAQVEDIATAALFLASPGARHITGQNLVVDGGWTIYSPLSKEHPQGNGQ